MEKESKFICMKTQFVLLLHNLLLCHSPVATGMVTGMKENGYRIRDKVKGCTGQQMVPSMMYVCMMNISSYYIIHHNQHIAIFT